MTSSSATHAATAAHRFGLGEASLDSAVRGDPRAWLASQLGAADAQRAVNGETLHIDHGYPLRLIGPDRPGVMQTKWVTRLVVR